MKPMNSHTKKWIGSALVAILLLAISSSKAHADEQQNDDDQQNMESVGSLNMIEFNTIMRAKLIDDTFGGGGLLHCADGVAAVLTGGRMIPEDSTSFTTYLIPGTGLPGGEVWTPGETPTTAAIAEEIFQSVMEECFPGNEGVGTGDEFSIALGVGDTQNYGLVGSNSTQENTTEIPEITEGSGTLY